MEKATFDAERVKRLDTFMQRYLQMETGAAKRTLYNDFKEDIESVTPLDIFHLRMYGDKTDFSTGAIKESADRFVNLFHKGLAKHRLREPMHPLFRLLLAENEAIKNQLDALKPQFQRGLSAKKKGALAEGFEALGEIEKKFVMMQNILFPAMEAKAPSARPMQVLWSLHDEALKKRTSFMEMLQEDHTDATFFKEIGEVYFLIRGILQKEELILFPTAREVIPEETLDKMHGECLEHGFAFIRGAPPEMRKSERPLCDAPTGRFYTETADLSLEQVALLFDHLPLDITYVDAEDKVRYFNRPRERHFPRTPAVIGRRVQNCHPPESVEVVEKILQAFKKGTRDVAEFHIPFRERFLHIRYFAVRDEEKRYRGVLEVSQDISRIQDLQGEKRLLDWEE